MKTGLGKECSKVRNRRGGALKLGLGEEFSGGGTGRGGLCRWDWDRGALNLELEG